MLAGKQGMELTAAWETTSSIVLWLEFQSVGSYSDSNCCADMNKISALVVFSVILFWTAMLIGGALYGLMSTLLKSI